MSTELVGGELRIGWAGDPTDPAVVLVHGSMDRSAGMLRLSRRLSDDFHVVRYDRRGYGESSHASGPGGVAAHVDDLVAIIDGIVGNDADRTASVRLFGHSFGGNVALAAAARRPRDVAAVALYEVPLSWLPWWPTTTAGAVASEAGDPADAAEAFMRRLVGDEVWERLPERTRRARRAEGPAMVAELRDLRRAAPWDAAEVAQPVLAMVGEHGQEHHRRGMRHLADSLRDARLVTIDGAGHGAPNSHPDVLTQLLRDEWITPLRGC